MSNNCMYGIMLDMKMYSNYQPKMLCALANPISIVILRHKRHSENKNIFRKSLNLGNNIVYHPLCSSEAY